MQRRVGGGERKDEERNAGIVSIDCHPARPHRNKIDSLGKSLLLIIKDEHDYSCKVWTSNQAAPPIHANQLNICANHC